MKLNFNIQPQERNIVEIYVSITCIFHKFIDSSIYVSNSEHSILDFHKENTIVTKQELPSNINNKYVSILEHLHQFFLDVYMDDISDMIYQIYHLHLKHYFIQQQHNINY